MPSRPSFDLSTLARRGLGVALFGLITSACTTKPAAEPVPEPPTSAEPAEKPEPAAPGGECVVDADCVPASCCHATSCVPAAQKPDCSDAMCTMQCEPNTLDCGGGCACEAGSCKAVFGTP
jgi:hypothetical protein